MADSEEQQQSASQENEGGEQTMEADQNQSAEAENVAATGEETQETADAEDGVEQGTGQDKEEGQQQEEGDEKKEEEVTQAQDEAGEDKKEGEAEESQQANDEDGQAEQQENEEGSQEVDGGEAQTEQQEGGEDEGQHVDGGETQADQQAEETVEEEAGQEAEADGQNEQDTQEEGKEEGGEEKENAEEGQEVEATEEEAVAEAEGGGEAQQEGETVQQAATEDGEVDQQEDSAAAVAAADEVEAEVAEVSESAGQAEEAAEQEADGEGEQGQAQQEAGEETEATTEQQDEEADKEDSSAPQEAEATQSQEQEPSAEEGEQASEQAAEGTEQAEAEQAADAEPATEGEQAETEQAADAEQAETEQAAEAEQAETEQAAEVTEQAADAEQAGEEAAEGKQSPAAEQTAEAEQSAEVEQAGEEQVAKEEQAAAEEAPAQEAEEGEGQAAGDAQTQEEKVATPVETENTQEQTDENTNAPSVSEDPNAPPPAPHLPTPERTHTSIEGQMSTSALNVVWSFGLNRNVPVLNLSDGVRQAIMYPCAHVGIMYDFKNNKQHILQAHLNPITCTAASQDKRWLVTGDVGPDAMVNIWDTYTGTPIQTMFDPNPSGGVVAVALTPDSRYLATLSALPTQTLAIWDWTVDGDVPICSADLKPEFGLQNFIYFDPTDIHHVVTNSETQVLFYHWQENSMQYFAPPLTDNDFNKPVGRYSQSLFQRGIARALTATSIGNLVVWDNNKPLSKFMDVNQSADKKPLKIIRIHDKGINVLTTTDNYIVVGDTAGHVKFFDQGLRLIYWYQDFHAGPCTAVSFAYMPDFVPIPEEGHKYPSDATKQAKPFVIRDFVVGTAIAVYGNIRTDGSKFKVIHREHDAAVHALAAHPKLPIIAMGSYSGLLKLWNYRTKEVVASRMFEKAHIHCVTFDPKGFYIAVGCANGSLYLVDSVALLDQLTEPFRYAHDCITHISFSHNSAYFATADAGFAITAFKRQRKEGRNPYVWHGRYRSHYKTIKDLTFGVDPDSNKPKLLSLGEDRMLIEYDLNHMGKTHNHMVPCAEDRIEQSALPQCMTWYPPITKENFLLTVNDQFKLKCYNSTTKMCRKTVLGPTYGSPIQKMMVVPAHDGDETKNRFLAYITDDKVGLHILPATGNPHLSMALIAHPSGVSNLTCSFDGAYLFTAGGPDFAVHMWEINVKALQAQAKLGGEDLIPFYGLLDGGRDGEMFAELEDLFYYAQLRHQGINSTGSREIGNKIPITEVPFVMRAMGYYPSEQEIEDMLNEIKYEEYVSSGRYQEDIDLGSFIRLYVNHRPAFGLSAEKLLWAFKTLAESPDLGDHGFIERGDLLEILQKKGEHMTEYELAEHLTTLLGFNQEGGSCEQEPFEAEKAGQFIAENLPYDVNAEILINEILGFSMTVDEPIADESRDVYKFSKSNL